jgi:hypothetical protein
MSITCNWITLQPGDVPATTAAVAASPDGNA